MVLNVHFQVPALKYTPKCVCSLLKCFYMVNYDHAFQLSVPTQPEINYKAVVCFSDVHSMFNRHISEMSPELMLGFEYMYATSL